MYGKARSSGSCIPNPPRRTVNNQGLVVFSKFTIETAIRNNIGTSTRSVLWGVTLGLEEDGWGEILLFALNSLLLF